MMRPSEIRARVIAEVRAAGGGARVAFDHADGAVKAVLTWPNVTNLTLRFERDATPVKINQQIRAAFRQVARIGELRAIEATGETDADGRERPDQRVWAQAALGVAHEERLREMREGLMRHLGPRLPGLGAT